MWRPLHGCKALPRCLLKSYCCVAGTADLIGVNWKESAVADASELDCTGVADMNACECGRLAAYAAALELANYQAIVDTIVSRLDPARTTVMKANFTARLESLLADRPEQVPFLSTLSPGTDHQDRLQLQLDSHVDFYFHGPGTVGASGQANVADEELSFAVVREQVQEVSIVVLCFSNATNRPKACYLGLPWAKSLSSSLLSG